MATQKKSKTQKKPRPLRRFKNKAVVPPGGYAYKDPDDGYVSQAATLDQLCMMVSRHRSANGMEVPVNLPEIVEDWICNQIPDSLCTGADAVVRTVSGRTITMTAAQASTTQILHQWRKHNRRTVSKDELARRARICSECKNNTSRSACLSCQGLNTWVKQWVGGCPMEKQLFVCASNAAMNIAQVHVPLDALKEITSDSVLNVSPPNCWKHAMRKEKKDAKRTTGRTGEHDSGGKDSQASNQRSTIGQVFI
jgi:hypothetical protein